MPDHKPMKNMEILKVQTGGMCKIYQTRARYHSLLIKSPRSTLVITQHECTSNNESAMAPI